MTAKTLAGFAGARRLMVALAPAGWSGWRCRWISFTTSPIFARRRPAAHLPVGALGFSGGLLAMSADWPTHG
jgi:hypothetical protein